MDSLGRARLYGTPLALLPRVTEVNSVRGILHVVYQQRQLKFFIFHLS